MADPTGPSAFSDYLLLDGVEVFYRVVGRGPRVLLVLPDHGVSADTTVAGLPPVDDSSTMVVVDLPGHGASGAPPTPFGCDAQDTSRLLAQLCDRLVAGRVAGILGLGAHAALARAAADAVGPAVLVSVDPGPGTTAAPAVELPDPTWDGAHLVVGYHAIRDRFLLRPGVEAQASTRWRRDLPSRWTLHRRFMDLLEHDGPAACPAVAASSDAASGTADDPAATTMVVEAGDPSVLDATEALGLPGVLDRVLAALPEQEGKVAVRPPTFEDDSITRRRVSVPVPGTGEWCEIELRGRRGGDRTPIVLLAASPASAASLAPMLDRWGTDRLVVTMDNPGQGRSQHPAGEGPFPIELYAGLVAEVLAACGIEDFHVWGSHTGAAIAVALAVAEPERTRTLMMDGLGLYDEPDRAAFEDDYFQDLAPDRHGSHLLRAWHQRRDMLLWFPWYSSDAEHARMDTLPAGPQQMHDMVVDFLRSGPTYRHAYHSALTGDKASLLRQVRVPAFLGASDYDPLSECLGTAGEILPSLVVREIPGRRTPEGFDATLDLLEEFLTPHDQVYVRAEQNP